MCVLGEGVGVGCVLGEGVCRDVCVGGRERDVCVRGKLCWDVCVMGRVYVGMCVLDGRVCSGVCVGGGSPHLGSSVSFYSFPDFL